MQIQPERMVAMLSLGPVLHLNEGESLIFTGEKTVEAAARAIFAKTRNAVIVTLGEKGSYCYDGADHYAAPVPAVVKDTIGAGDSHMGSVISARRFGLSFADAIRAANHISSAVVSRESGMLEKEDFAKALASMPEELKKRFQ